MKLKIIRSTNETQDLLISITKTCETLIKQTQIKPKETFEFKMIKPRETFQFNPPIQGKEDWMLGLVDLEVYNLFLTEQNKIANLTF